MNCSAKDILELSIISINDAGKNIADAETQSRVIVKRPIAKRAGRSTTDFTPPPPPEVQVQTQFTLKKSIESTFQMEIPSNGRITSGI